MLAQDGTSTPEISFTDPTETSHTLRLVLLFLTSQTCHTLRLARPTEHLEDLLNAYKFGEKYDCVAFMRGLDLYVRDKLAHGRFSPIDVFIIGSILDKESWVDGALYKSSIDHRSELTPTWGKLEGDQMIRPKNFTLAMFERIPPRYIYALVKTDADKTNPRFCHLKEYWSE